MSNNMIDKLFALKNLFTEKVVVNFK